MKNTMGYSLNALVDFDTPLEILWHLLVGSEGTLAFIAEAVFCTVPDLNPGFRDVRTRLVFDGARDRAGQKR